MTLATLCLGLRKYPVPILVWGWGNTFSPVVAAPYHVSALLLECVYLLLALYNIYLFYQYIFYSIKCIPILNPLNEFFQTSLILMQSEQHWKMIDVDDNEEG